MARRYSNLKPILVDLETPGLVPYIAVLTKRDGTVRDLMEEIERTYTRLFSQYSAEEFPITSLRRRVDNGKQMLLPAWYPIEPLLSDYDSVIIVAAIPQYQSSSLVVECSTTLAFSEQTHSAGGILANSTMIDPNISSNEAVCQRKRKLDDNIVHQTCAESESVNEQNEEVSKLCDQESVNCMHKRGKRGKRRRKEKEDAIDIAEIKEDSKFLAEKTQQEMAGKGNEERSVSNRRERAEGSEAQSEKEGSLKSDCNKIGKKKIATSNKSRKIKDGPENKESDEQTNQLTTVMDSEMKLDLKKAEVGKKREEDRIAEMGNVNKKDGLDNQQSFKATESDVRDLQENKQNKEEQMIEESATCEKKLKKKHKKRHLENIVLDLHGKMEHSGLENNTVEDASKKGSEEKSKCEEGEHSLRSTEHKFIAPKSVMNMDSEDTSSSHRSPQKKKKKKKKCSSKDKEEGRSDFQTDSQNDEDTESTKSLEGRSGLSTSDQIVNDPNGVEDVTLVAGNDTTLDNFKVCKEGDSVANNAKDGSFSILSSQILDKEDDCNETLLPEAIDDTVNSNILLDMKYDATSSTQKEKALVQKELCSAEDKTSSPQKEIVPVQKNAPSSTEKEYNTRLKKNSTKSNGNTKQKGESKTGKGDNTSKRPHKKDGVMFDSLLEDVSVASSNFIARPTAKQSPGSSLVQTPISGFLTKADRKRFNGKVKKF